MQMWHGRTPYVQGLQPRVQLYRDRRGRVARAANEFSTGEIVCSGLIWGQLQQTFWFFLFFLVFWFNITFWFITGHFGTFQYVKQ